MLAVSVGVHSIESPGVSCNRTLFIALRRRTRTGDLLKKKNYLIPVRTNKYLIKKRKNQELTRDKDLNEKLYGCIFLSPVDIIVNMCLITNVLRDAIL